MKISGKTLWIIVSMLALNSCSGLLTQQQQAIAEIPPPSEETTVKEEKPKEEASATIVSQQQPQPSEEIAPPAEGSTVTEEKPKEETPAAIVSQQQPQPSEDTDAPVSMPGQNSADHLDDEESGGRPARRGFSTLLGSTVLQEELKAKDVVQQEGSTEAPIEAEEPKKEKKKLRNTHKATRPTPEQEAAAYRLLNNTEAVTPEPLFPNEPERPTLRLRGYGATEANNESETGLPPMPNAVELRGFRSPGLRRGNLPMDINGKLMPINQR